MPKKNAKESGCLFVNRNRERLMALAKASLEREIERQEDAGHDTQNVECGLAHLPIFPVSDDVDFYRHPTRTELIRTAAQCLRMAAYFEAMYQIPDDSDQPLSDEDLARWPFGEEVA